MYEHLLVPVDGSELSDRAMTASVELARKLGAKITGFIAEPFAAPPPGIGLGYGAAVTQHDQATQKHAHAVLSEFERLCHGAGVPFAPYSTQSGHIEDAIIDAARERRCDMIVMITHSRGTLGELMWGSHTKNLLSRCKLPLLVLH
jgi:nucleotide-binding universal stress UspA family protein